MSAPLAFEQREVLDEPQLRHLISKAGTEKDADTSLQFTIWHVAEGGMLKPAMEVEPDLDADEPDVRVGITLEAFNIPLTDSKATQATVRLTVGSGKSPEANALDDAFWCIAAGLNLYKQIKGGSGSAGKTQQPASPSDLQSNFNGALKRPIEIRGGIATVQFDVVKHPEPPLWQRIFGFAQSGAGQALTAALGFPAIVHSALNLVDQALDRLLSEKRQESIFRSNPLRIALSKPAKLAYVGKNPAIAIAGLTKLSWLVLARVKDYQLLLDASPVTVDVTHGVLVPKGMKPQTPDAFDPQKNPLLALPYAVMKVWLSKHTIAMEMDTGEN